MTDQVLTLGIDGGGSGCRAAIADAKGAVIGKGDAGPANATTDIEEALKNVQAAISMALTDAGLPQDAAQSMQAHIGLAGILSQADADRFAANLAIPHAIVTDDRPTNLAGALDGKTGLLAAVGTGSFIGAQSGDTQQFLGGWGLQLGDQASGAWLGRALLKRVLLIQDGLREETPFAASVLQNFQSDPNAIVIFARDAAPEDYAALAAPIFKAAANGDTLGIELVKRGVTYLTSAFARLDPDPKSPICLTGGLGSFYADWMPAPYDTRLKAPTGTALDGALLLAKRQPQTAP